MGHACATCHGVLSSPVQEIENEAEGPTSAKLRTAPQGTSRHRVLDASPEFSTCVKMMRVEAMLALVSPWPRCQDLPDDAFKSPAVEDFVFAVSHGWPYQTHPDPLGVCAAEVEKLLREALAVHRPPGVAVGFYDFTSVTQRPFREDQADRTARQSEAFKQALVCMPKVYLFADAVLHVDVPWMAVPGDGELLLVDACKLQGAAFSQVGAHVQVSKLFGEVPGGDPHPHIFDIVVGIDSTEVAQRVSVDDVSAAVAKGEGKVLVRRSPYGQPNNTQLDRRGWIYLERFVSMVKVAMVDESEAPRVVFSNSREVLDEILDGGMVLRRAAQNGERVLQRTLDDFFDVLATKTFGGASTDKLLNKDFLDNFAPGGSAVDGDRHVVAAIMRDMVRSLPERWAGEAVRQRQRQFELAVNRGDAEACAALLAATADVNHMTDVTALHLATRRLDAVVVQVLLRARADCAAHDVYGDCPAHYSPLFDTEEAVQMFDLVTPSLDVLNKENVTFVTPFERYRLWAQTALDNKPYPPAQARVEELLRIHPSLSSDGPAAKRSNALRHKHSLAGRPVWVRRKTQECSVLGREISLAIWEPREVLTTVVWNLHFSAQLYEEALDWVAQHVCEQLGTKIVAVSLVQCAQMSASTTWSVFCAEVAAVIDALPLPRKFVLVDDNVATSCGWLLQHRLSGLLMINCDSVFDEEYLRSGSFLVYNTFLGRVAQSFRDRDTRFLVDSVVRNACFDVTPEVLKFVEETFAAQDAADWDLAAFSTQSAANGDISREVVNRRARDPPVPATVVNAAMGAKVAQQKSGMILRELLSNCELEFLLQSKKWWHLEGQDAWVDIVLVLQRLLARANTRE